MGKFSYSTCFLSGAKIRSAVIGADYKNHARADHGGAQHNT